MRGVAITIGLVVMAGCGPDFDSLFRAGPASDAGSTPSPPPAKDASQDAPIDAGEDEKSDAGDAGCAVRSCTPVVSCDALGACTYSCDGCGCVCSAPCPNAPGKTSCTATCAEGTTCDATCNAGTAGLSPGMCTFAARGARKAAYSCGSQTGVCKATCDEGADCSLACYQLNTECHLTCSDAASCLLQCNYVNGCLMDCPSGALQNCLDGSKTCNRKCP